MGMADPLREGLRWQGRRGRGARMLAILAMFVLLAAACGNDDNAPDEDDATGTQDPVGVGDECPPGSDGSSITVSLGSQPVLDPVASGAVGLSGGSEVAAIYDLLLDYDRETGEYALRLAESLEPNDDYSVWTLRLQSGIVFGNGDPLTADAVRHSIERHQDPDNSSLALALSQSIIEMNVIDELTIEFELDSPWAGFPYFLAEKGGQITNPGVVEELGEELQTMPVGAGVGPYEVTNYVSGEEILMTAKEDYWGGPVCIERIRFVYIEDKDARHDAFLNRELDVVQNDLPSVLAEVDRGGDVNGFGILIHGGSDLLMNAFDDSAAPTTDVRVREAIVKALDVDAISSRVFDDGVMPTKLQIHPTSPLAGGVEGPAYDPDRAEALVEEAKAEGWDGGLTLTCSPPVYGDEFPLAIKAQLDAVGFDVTIESIPPGEIVPRLLQEKNFELACFALGIYDEAIWERFNQFFRSDSAQNLTGVESDEIDQAVADLRMASSPEDVGAAVAIIEEAFAETYPVANIATTEVRVMWADNVHGLRFGLKGITLFDGAYVD